MPLGTPLHRLPPAWRANSCLPPRGPLSSRGTPSDIAKRGWPVASVQETVNPEATPDLLKIPAFPPIAIRLLRLLANENIAIGEILELLRADPAFSAEMLRQANSALFGFSSQISSLQHALVVLGLRRVRTLTMTVATGIYVRKTLQIGELRRCWRHTLACALLAEELARACLAHVDLAYTAGLLHDIGRLGLLVAYPEEYSGFVRTASEKAAGPEPFDFLDYERLVFGRDHCQAGTWLVGQWKLPQEFAQITGRHHDPPCGNEMELLGLVYLGCQLADALGFYVVDTGRFLSFEEIRSALPEPAQHRLASDADALRELVEKRIQSYDIEEMSPPLPAAQQAGAEQRATPEESPPAQEEVRAPVVAAAAAPHAPQKPTRAASTWRRDLVAALITCLVAGTAFFFVLRSLWE